ncbi:MgtC/SapB family protein [Corynebacterium hindlerae]|uniref:MgtC/SapB family protein n=1 Tax=Corynebacterium hindlerae TaxID=699041 RepID=UPI001AD76221|nr:MgtC/SapB family protein [Corynebacterium hindlerae]QTH59954.1 MgtC/SapB family protein [Corynebacterium hindlerae]
MTLLNLGHLTAHLSLAFVLGILIGSERQLRARAAGLRTTTLISLGSALFTVLGAEAFGGGDPTRVTAQIVSGIGFLGGGVIIKHGASISGLNTAATMWSSAAIGALCGTGLWEIALIGSILIVLANSVLRPLSRMLAKTTELESEDASYAAEPAM